MKQIYINDEDFEINIAIVEDGKLINFWTERSSYAKIGNIYKGKIIKVINNMNFAFVDIGDEKPGFLSEKAYNESLDIDSMKVINDENERRNISEVFHKGQDILVQVVRPPYKTKGARLTTNITLPGYYTVFSPNSNQIGISKKVINEKERRRLREILLKMREKISKSAGLIARTTSEGISNKKIEEEIKHNFKRWQNILKSYKKEKAPALLYEEEKFYLRILRDTLNNSINEIIVDSEGIYNDIKKYIKKAGINKPKLKLYKGVDSIFKYYNLENQINNLKSRIIPFKKGGYLKIDTTEALTVIDVNSGKFKGESDVESSILMLNLNAAKEIARQIILRNIGGLIVVDFIDMQSEENKRMLRKELEQELSKSKIYFKTTEINEFGLLVISRKRVVDESGGSFYDICPYCSGNGVIPSKESICIEQLKKIKYICKSEKKKEIVFNLAPEIKQEIQKRFSLYIKKYEKEYKKKIIFN
ncbi:MAG: Rne/Rng family ribonuclease [Candidatus Goldbacteria bacterium]|nr:Rne/Rng family ribonuclease [Candidatus Goldiibacteriota bacterium]